LSGARRWLLAVGLVLALSGCSDQASFDPTVVETYLRTSQAEVFPDQDLGQAVCPDHVALREGLRIACTLEVAGEAIPYDVELTDVAGDRVTISTQPRGALIPLETAERYVLDSLPADAEGASVTCGEGAVVAARRGATISCTVQLGSQTEPVVLEVLDDAGTVRIAD
jgi:hypothetical protein